MRRLQNAAVVLRIRFGGVNGSPSMNASRTDEFLTCSLLAQTKPVINGVSSGNGAQSPLQLNVESASAQLCRGAFRAATKRHFGLFAARQRFIGWAGLPAGIQSDVANQADAGTASFLAMLFCAKTRLELSYVFIGTVP